MSDLMLGTSEINCADLPAVLANLPSKEGWFKLAILEWWNAPTEFLEYSSAMLERIKGSPADLISGSIFGPEVELRWRKVNGPVRATT